jgi:aspartate kinase
MGSFITFEDSKALEAKHPIAATLKEGVIVLNIISNRKSVSHGFFEKLFSILDAHGIVVDLISTTQVQISMAISNNDMAARPLEPIIRELSIHGDVDVSRDLAILSLVGKDMKRSVGVASKMFNILAKNSVNIHMISQGIFYSLF